VVACAEVIVERFVGGVGGSGEGGFGGSEAGQGAVPFSDHEGLLVMPDLIRHPPALLPLRWRRREEGGPRIKSGVTNEGRGAGAGQQRPSAEFKTGSPRRTGWRDRPRRLAAGGWNAAVRSTMLPVNHPSPPCSKALRGESRSKAGPCSADLYIVHDK